MISSRQCLKQIKEGKYGKVIVADDNGNAAFAYLQYNSLRRKYFVRDSLDAVRRRTINKREAIFLLTRSLYVKRKLAEAPLVRCKWCSIKFAEKDLQKHEEECNLNDGGKSDRNYEESENKYFD